VNEYLFSAAIRRDESKTLVVFPVAYFSLIAHIEFISDNSGDRDPNVSILKSENFRFMVEIAYILLVLLFFNIYNEILE